MSELEPQPQPDSQVPDWQPTGPSGPRAGFWRRFVAFVIDTVVISVGFLVLVFLGAALDDVLAVIVVLAAVVGAFAYFIVLEGGPRGQTLGKRALGIRVVDEETGRPIGYPRATGRLFARYLSQLPIYLGYLWMLWDREKQTWHDKLTSSLVVPEKYYPVS